MTTLFTNGHYWYVFREVLTLGNGLPTNVRLRLVRYLLWDLACRPLHWFLWTIDEIFFGTALNKVKLKDPAFIISQPRSGTTFLHRTLALDRTKFFAITYLEWHWPYICVWKLIDTLGLRPWIDSWNYWPTRNEAGQAASKMHPHLYGDYEEHGVFLEEKFYCHYFVFRRFPLLSVLFRTANIKNLGRKQTNRIFLSLLRVVHKVAYYRGGDRRWLTKENESVDFYRLLISEFPNASLIFLVRDLTDMLSSYVTLSGVSTQTKSGLDLDANLYWSAANIDFRRRQCRDLCALFLEVTRANKAAVLVNYDRLVGDILASVKEVYSKFYWDMDDRFIDHLEYLASRQKQRARTYKLAKPILPIEMVGFRDFINLVERSKGGSNHENSDSNERQSGPVVSDERPKRRGNIASVPRRSDH